MLPLRHEGPGKPGAEGNERSFEIESEPWNYPADAIEFSILLEQQSGIEKTKKPCLLICSREMMVASGASGGAYA